MEKPADKSDLSKRLEGESSEVRTGFKYSPVMEDQELDTRGTTMIIYWEGACEVKGKVGEKDVSGRAYIELVGYDRSHESPNLAYFLMGNSFEFPGKSFFD